MAIQLDRFLVDYDWTEEEHKPVSFGVFIAGRRGRLFSHVNCPGAQGPHPVVIFCHGLPGHETMADFAQSLRHVGFCTITFHYSGSWGSDGSFSVGNCFEDVDSVLQYVLDNDNGLFDLDNLFLVGHSVGGLVGAHALTHRALKAGAIITPFNFGGIYHKAQESDEANAFYRMVLEQTAEWLRGYDWCEFEQEFSADADRFTLETYGEPLSQKPVLAIAAAMDFDLPRHEHIDLLTDAIKAKDGANLVEATFPTNHDMCDQRYAIILAIAEFFANQTH